MAARGPKGWVRPDDRILDELCEAVVRAGVDAGELEVAVTDGEVRLAGALLTRAERALVVRLAERILGVRGLDVRVATREEAEDEGPTWH